MREVQKGWLSVNLGTSGESWYGSYPVTSKRLGVVAVLVDSGRGIYSCSPIKAVMRKTHLVHDSSANA